MVGVVSAGEITASNVTGENTTSALLPIQGYFGSLVAGECLPDTVIRCLKFWITIDVSWLF